jgi:hypothetical protein
MKIKIQDTRTIQEIQEKFTAYFPYLKLEFFSKSHKPGEGSARILMKPNDRTIGQSRTINKEGYITIDPQMTVSELEQRFKEFYGLNAQVFRKSGRVWLETTMTDGWTLEEQNSQGQTLSEVIMYTPPSKKRI